MSATKKTAVAFYRVSSDDQKRDGFSLEAQEKLSERYAKDRNLLIVKPWAVAESASKENDRGSFFEMIDYVKTNKIGDVIFDKVDRACRGLKSAQVLEELVEKSSVRFHFTRENLILDENSPSSDKLRFYLHVILAKYYIDNLKSEIKKGMDERQELGFWNYKAPLGYKNVRPEGETKADRGKATVEIDPQSAPFVKEAFELYASGNYAVRDLVKFFNDRLETRQIGKGCVETMLTNPFYIGSMRTRGLVIPGRHAPLITKELWDTCQRMKGIRGEGHELSAAAAVSKPYMGLMRCGVCSHFVTGEVKRKANGKTYVYYHCANLDCPERRNNVAQASVEEQVIRAFEPFSKLTPAATKAFAEALRSSLDDIELYSHRQLTQLTDQIGEIKVSMAKVKTLHKNGMLSQNEFDSLIEEKRARLAEAETEIHATMKADKAAFAEGISLIELLQNSYDFMRFSKDSLKKAHLAKSVLSNPILEKGTLRYDYRKPFDVLIELTARKNWWSQQESNLEQSFRKAPLYPFNYGTDPED